MISLSTIWTLNANGERKSNPVNTNIYPRVSGRKEGLPSPNPEIEFEPNNEFNTKPRALLSTKYQENGDRLQPTTY
jgi:hypothetical protein